MSSRVCRRSGKTGFFSIYCVCVLVGRKRLFLSLLHGFTQRWTLITKFVSNLVLFSGFNQVSTASSWAVGDVFVRHLRSRVILA